MEQQVQTIAKAGNGWQRVVVAMKAGAHVVGRDSRPALGLGPGLRCIGLPLAKRVLAGPAAHGMAGGALGAACAPFHCNGTPRGTPVGPTGIWDPTNTAMLFPGSSTSVTHHIGMKVSILIANPQLTKISYIKLTMVSPSMGPEQHHNECTHQNVLVRVSLLLLLQQHILKWRRGSGEVR